MPYGMFLAIPTFIYHSSYAIVNNRHAQGTCHATFPREQNQDHPIPKVPSICYDVPAKTRCLSYKCIYASLMEVIISSTLQLLSSWTCQPWQIALILSFKAIQPHSLEFPVPRKGTSIHQLTCKSHQQWNQLLLDGLNSQPRKDLHTRSMFTFLSSIWHGPVFCKICLECVCQTVDRTRPSPIEYAKQLHPVIHVNSDTNKLLH